MTKETKYLIEQQKQCKEPIAKVVWPLPKKIWPFIWPENLSKKSWLEAKRDAKKITE